MQGGVIQSINHGLSTGGLFLLVGIVYERRHTRQIADFGGISQVMPIYATLFMIILLASIGLPLLNGFVGEFAILVGAFLADWRWALFASLGVVLGRGLPALALPARLLRRAEARGKQGS